MASIPKYRLVLVACVVALLALASSAFAGTYFYAQKYFYIGQNGSSTYSYSWQWNSFNMQTDGSDKTVTFIDASDSYHWKATVRNTKAITTTDWFSPDHYKKAYCLHNGGPGGNGVCAVG